MSDYPYTPLYYGTPCLLKWYNVNTKKYQGGIGLRDLLIKGDGSIEKIDDVVAAAVKNGIDFEDAVIELDSSWFFEDFDS